MDKFISVRPGVDEVSLIASAKFSMCYLIQKPEEFHAITLDGVGCEITCDSFEMKQNNLKEPLPRSLTKNDYVQILVDSEVGLVVFQVNNPEDTKYCAFSHCFRFTAGVIKTVSKLSVMVLSKDLKTATISRHHDDGKEKLLKENTKIKKKISLDNQPAVRVFDVPVELAEKRIPLLANIER